MTTFQHIAILSKKPVGMTTVGRLLTAFAGFLVLCLVFAFVAREVFEGETLRHDDQVLLFINRFSSPFLDKAMLTITTLFSPGGVIVIAAVALGVLYRFRRWNAMTLLAASIAGAGIFETGMKYIFERQRPHLWNLLVHETSFSFPSGHATMSMAIAAALVVILWPTKWRWLSLAVGAVFVLLVGFSRLYLGVHYPTDIFAGWIVALAWVLAVATITGMIRWPDAVSVKR